LGRKRKKRLIGIKLSFQLDQRLDSDTFHIGDLPISRVLLMNASNFPWVILVPRIPDIRELFHLDAKERLDFQMEVDFL